ncbi:MAG: hypothetical protein CMJ87_08685 [Planctomycetes bacterium]|nr:hypothetical protein [Planctomycetota bacterium]
MTPSNLEEVSPALADMPAAALVIAGLLLLGALASAPRVFRLQARIAGPWGGPRPGTAPWSLRQLAALLGLLAGAALLVSGGLRLFGFGGAAQGDEPSLLLTLLATNLVLGLPAIGLVLFVRRPAGGGLARLGLGSSGGLRAALGGACAWLLLLPGILGLGILWPALLAAAGQTPQAQPFIDDFLTGSGMSLALAVFLAAIVTPLLEELLFRGFLQPLLAERLGSGAAIVITSLLFSALHGLSASGPIFGLSLVLGMTMARTGRLAGPWAIHALHNGGTLLLLLTVPEFAELLPEGGLIPFRF